MPNERSRARRGLAQQLESLQQAGVTHIGKVKSLPAASRTAASAPRKAAATTQVARPAPKAAPSQTAAPPAKLFADSIRSQPGLPLVERIAALDVIRTEVASCRLCDELAANRTQTVFGVGNPEARLCFLGEAPGADEDRQGEPFVGRAGQLLNKILEACGLKREEVYIFNICKCRPPDNRTPAPTEATNCRGYLDRQIDLIRPEFIGCLGSVAAQNLLGTTASIGRLRGRVHDYRGIKVVCTYHPAYLLRNPAAKGDTWQDMQLLMREMGREIPGRQ